MLPCNSGASNSNANFQPKQNIRRVVAQYSVNNNKSHVDVTTSRLFSVKFRLLVLFRFRHSIDTTVMKYATVKWQVWPTRQLLRGAVRQSAVGLFKSLSRSVG